jgi:hypothetical protein
MKLYISVGNLENFVFLKLAALEIGPCRES